MSKKVIGISCSPRKGKNTEFAVQSVLQAVQADDAAIETEFISLAGKKIGHCTACGFCKSNFSCSQHDDFTGLIPHLKDDSIKAIVLGSPVYMGGMNSVAKAFIDRAVLFRRNGFHFRGLFGAAVAVGGSRNGGQELVIQGIHTGFLLQDMIIVSDGMPTSHFGGTGWERVPGGIEKDKDSLSTFENLGKNLAYSINRLKD